MLRSGAVFSAIAVLTACSQVHPSRTVVPNNGDRIVITEEMIARSGGSNAWEVLKRTAPQLTYRDRREGQPTKLERRGNSSLVLNDSPMLFVDGVRLPDFRSLESIPAKTIARIEILNGIDGTTYYGTDAEAGVILISTKNGT
jgi:outer membrane cobalamin receptor